MPNSIRRVAGAGAAVAAAAALSISAAGAASAVDFGSLGSLDMMGSLAGGDSYEGVAPTLKTSVSDDGSTNTITLTQNGPDDADVQCRAYVVDSNVLSDIDDHDLKLMISQGEQYQDDNPISEKSILQLDTDSENAEQTGNLTAAGEDVGDYTIVSACFNSDNGRVGPQKTFTIVEKDGVNVFAQGGGLLGSLNLGSLSAS